MKGHGKNREGKQFFVCYKALAEVECSPKALWSDGFRLGLGLTGKVCHAWVGAWVWCMGGG